MAKQSDIYGYSSDEDTPPHVPPMPNQDESVAAANLSRQNSRDGASVDAPAASPKSVPGVFSRTAPSTSSQPRTDRHPGPVDVDAVGNGYYPVRNFANENTGSYTYVTPRVKIKRPSLDDVDASLTKAAQNNRVSFKSTTDNVNGTRKEMKYRPSQFSDARSNANANPQPEPSRLRSILMNKKLKDNQSDTATHVTQGSGASSIFGNARSKLKGYLSTYKDKKQLSDHHKLDPHNLSASLSDVGSVGSKSRRSRLSFNLSNPQNSTAANGKSGDAASQTSTVKTKFYDGTSKKLAKKKSSKQAGELEIQVFELPWADNRPGSCLRGRYSGPVDKGLQPHGKGLVVLEGNDTVQFFAVFNHGNLASGLICRSEDEINGTNNGNNIPRNNPISAPPAPRTRAAEEPSGVLSDEIPFKPHYNPVQTTRNEKKKQPAKAPSVTRRVSTESTRTTKIKQSTSPKPTSPPPRRNIDHLLSDHKRTKYALGDIARSPKDMIIHKSENEAIHSASLLKKYEQAFLKRSNGLWTAAVLADRMLQPIQRKHQSSSQWLCEWEIDPTVMELEDSMLFVINEDGATKIVQRRHWGKFVRRMNLHDMDEGGEEDEDDNISAAGTDEA